MHRNIFGFILIMAILLPLKAYSQSIDEEVNNNIKKAEALISEGNKSGAAQVYNQTAYLLRSNDRFDEAAELYQKVLDINLELGNRRGQMISHNNLSVLYLEAERYPKAIYHLQKELEYRKQINNKSEIINVLTNLATAQNEVGSYDSAIENIEQAINFSKELNDLALLKQSYGVAYDIYDRQGNSDKSYKYFELYSAIDRKLKEQKMAAISTEANRKVNEAETETRQTRQRLDETSNQLEETKTTLLQVEELTREQQMEIELKEAKISEQKALLETEALRRKFWIIGFSISFVFVLGLSLMIWIIFRANKKINAQRLRLEKQNKEIHASIRYAKTIQDAMLPSEDLLKKYFDPFILFRPKDIVSGDFYWVLAQEHANRSVVFVAVVDCTGHGVPGAFMSMIGNRLLNEIVSERKMESPAEILLSLNGMIREVLRQEETDNNDGMDLALCRFEFNKSGERTVTFSGAKRPLYIIKGKDNKLITHPGDRKSIGGYSINRKEALFFDKVDHLDKGDTIYMFSDGILDQNGPERKKFGRVRLEEIMVDASGLTMDKQKELFIQRLDEYRSGEEQRDDISLLGLKVI